MWRNTDNRILWACAHPDSNARILSFSVFSDANMQALVVGITDNLGTEGDTEIRVHCWSAVRDRAGDRIGMVQYNWWIKSLTRRRPWLFSRHTGRDGVQMHPTWKNRYRFYFIFWFILHMIRFQYTLFWNSKSLQKRLKNNENFIKICHFVRKFCDFLKVF